VQTACSGIVGLVVVTPARCYDEDDHGFIDNLVDQAMGRVHAA
jgi:hypothetical protein